MQGTFASGQGFLRGNYSKGRLAGMSEHLSPVTVGVLFRAVFVRWSVALVNGAWAIVGLLDGVDNHIAPKYPSFKAIWDRWYVIPSFGWQTWVMIAVVILGLCALQGAYSFAKKYSDSYQESTAHRVIPHVMRKSSQTYLGKWMGTPVVRAHIALKFENIGADDVTLKDITLILYERGTRAWKGWVRELGIRGPKPERLYEKPMMLWEYDDPRKGVSVAGLRIKSRDFPPDAYFYLDDRMVFDAIELRNGIHFLRLTVEAVAQRPYIVDIDVDWSQPGLWILSATPVFDARKTIRFGQKVNRVTVWRKDFLNYFHGAFSLVNSLHSRFDKVKKRLMPPLPKK
jgi:hypothetical protein